MSAALRSSATAAYTDVWQWHPFVTALRSTRNCSDFDVPRSRRKIGQRDCHINNSHFAAHVELDVISDLKKQQSTSSFKRHLKSYLFTAANSDFQRWAQSTDNVILPRSVYRGRLINAHCYCYCQMVFHFGFCGDSGPTGRYQPT